MLTLDKLKDYGSVSTEYESVGFKPAISLSDFLNALENGEDTHDRPVVLDGCLWAATIQRMPVTKADTVLSHDGDKFGCWKKSENSFSTMVLIDNKLSTIKKTTNNKRKKEDIDMARPKKNANVVADLGDELDSLLEQGMPATDAEAVDTQKAEAKTASHKKKKEDTSMAESTQVPNGMESLNNELDSLLGSSEPAGGTLAGGTLAGGTPAGGTQQPDLVQASKELDALLDNAGPVAGAQKSKANFDGQGASDEKNLTPEQLERKRKREEKLREAEQALDAIRKKGQGDVTLNEKNITNNRMNGRLLFFITATDDVVKASLQRVPILDPNKNKVLVDNAPQDIRKKFQNGGKGIEKKWFVQESKFKFAHSKPGKIMGAVVRTPAATEGNLLDIYSKSDNTGNADGQPVGGDATVVRFMPLEAAYAYLAYNYESKIKEDDTILGARASVIELHPTAKTVKKSDVAGGAVEHRIVTQMRVRKLENVRKSVLVDGNFFPMTTYETASVANADAPTKELLNNNFSALLKSYYTPKKKDTGTKPIIPESELGENGLVTIVDSDQSTKSYTVTSKFIDGNMLIEIKRFDNNQPLTEVRLPLRIKEFTKNGNCVYKFRKVDMEAENGSLSNPKYAGLLSLTGLTSEEFAAKIKDVSSKSQQSTSRKSASIEITPQQYISFKAHPGNFADGGTGLGDIQRQLSGLDI